MKKEAPTLLILAAGMGSRYGGLKQVDRLGPSGETIIDYAVYDAIRAGFGKVVLVIRKSTEHDFLETYGNGFLNNIPYEFVYQDLDMLPDGFQLPEGRTKPWGTAHAIWVARHTIKTDFVVINADDFYDAPSYQALAGFISETERPLNSFAMCGYKLSNTLSPHGTVSRGVCRISLDNSLHSVEEHTKIGYDEAGRIISYIDGKSVELKPDTIVSMNIWAFNPIIFEFIGQYFSLFLQEHAGDLKSELYTPRLVDQLLRDGKAEVRVLNTNSQWFGVTYADDKTFVVDRIARLVENNQYPTPLWRPNDDKPVFNV